MRIVKKKELERDAKRYKDMAKYLEDQLDFLREQLAELKEEELLTRAYLGITKDNLKTQKEKNANLREEIKKITDTFREQKRKSKRYRFDGSNQFLLVVKGESFTVDPGDEIEINSRYMKTRKLRTLFTEVYK